MAAATFGLASGMSVLGVITATIAPSLVAANGWAPADFALVASLGLITALSFPLIGRLADVVGTRLTALVGHVALPLTFLAYSGMNGELWVYMVILALQNLICAATTSTVYARLIVRHFDRARGLALAIAASGPAVSGAIIAPLLNAYVEKHGWRASYEVLAIGSAAAGLLLFALIPRDRAPGAAAQPAKRRARKDYATIFGAQAFWVLFVVMLLCNLPLTIVLVQLKLLMLANGVTGEGTAVMLTAVSIGMLAGRFVTGIALDRLPPILVSFVSLAIPSIGLFLIASSLDSPAVLTFAVFCVGFAFGAEGDLIAFLVARQFSANIYSSVMGLLTFASAFSAAMGAALLSFTLARTGGYDLYLTIAGCAVLVGSGVLLLLKDTTAGPGNPLAGRAHEAPTRSLAGIG